MPSRIIRKWPIGEQIKVSRYMALGGINHRLGRAHQWVDVVEALHKDREWDKEEAMEEMPICNDDVERPRPYNKNRRGWRLKYNMMCGASIQCKISQLYLIVRYWSVTKNSIVWCSLSTSYLLRFSSLNPLPTA